ncbi:Chloroperoxidase [Sporodiniella umbellata]|nr:Chloroperoxidase [Sporodiniella umbellata]
MLSFKTTKKNKQIPFIKSTTKLRQVLFGVPILLLGLTVLLIEIVGRRKGLKSPKHWYGLLENHKYEYKDSYLRSPCPMLNTLANHGFIPRDGRNIAPTDFFNALMLLRAPPTFTVSFLIYVFFIYHKGSPTMPFISQFAYSPSIDLDRLTTYNMIEHDVSLTRQDYALPPYSTNFPVPHYVERLVLLSKLNNTLELQNYFTLKNEHDARKLRWLESYRDNKNLQYSLSQQFASGIECSLLLDIIGRKGSLKIDHLLSFLLHERFPEDWLPRETTFSVTEQIVNPVKCWWGLHQSEVSLDVLRNL